MSREIRARIEGVGETAMAAQEDVEANLRQLGSPSTRPGRWQLTERYFTTHRVTNNLVMFECDASFEWVPEIPDEAEEPF